MSLLFHVVCLSLSSQNGEEMCMKALVAFGANVNAKNNFNQTPLDIASENKVSLQLCGCDNIMFTVVIPHSKSIWFHCLFLLAVSMERGSPLPVNSPSDVELFLVHTKFTNPEQPATLTSFHAQQQQQQQLLSLERVSSARTLTSQNSWTCT